MSDKDEHVYQKLVSDILYDIGKPGPLNIPTEDSENEEDAKSTPLRIEENFYEDDERDTDPTSSIATAGLSGGVPGSQLHS